MKKIEEIRLSSFTQDQRQILYKIMAFQKFCPGKFLLSDPWPYEILNDEELEEFKDNLIGLMPLDTIVTDLWDWDIRFEKLTFEDRIFGIALGPDSEVEEGASALTQDMLAWIDEYGMDYAQNEYENDEFEKWIYELILNFLNKWRENIFDKLI